MSSALFFEIRGTVVEPAAGDEPLRAALESTIGSVDPDRLAWFEGRVREYRAGVRESPRADAVAALQEEFDLDVDTDRLTDELLTETAAASDVSEAARTSLEELAVGDRIGVLTDESRAWTERVLAHHDLDVFDEVVTAAEAGAPKPASAPFELARDRVQAEEYVLVGPEYDRDVEGARAAGFVPVHFETDGPDFWQTLNALV